LRGTPTNFFGVSRIIPVTRLCDWRSLVAVFVFSAFFLQSYVAQTHIHNAAAASHSLALAKDGEKAANAAQTPLKGHAPVPDDPADCPFCQAAVHANAVFTCVISIILLGAISVLRAPVFFASEPHALYRGHDEQQRGPPGL
jgi:hypothetical protein